MTESNGSSRDTSITNRREKLWQHQRDRARAIHKADPELPFRDIARRLGVKEHSVARWCWDGEGEPPHIGGAKTRDSKKK